MKYAKPELVLAGSAIVLVQGQGKPFHPNQDAVVGDDSYDCTIPAYPADE